ncbi:hypothetical protein ACCC92_16015 [Mucilaginibacter sp. Mucisp84]|uniref:hypothetical protein n=1 Tax=Mucilaginibacter sp. Mucisp84 TaxID=3243058 RepID=UPI0039A5E7F2
MKKLLKLTAVCCCLWLVLSCGNKPNNPAPNDGNNNGNNNGNTTTTCRLTTQYTNYNNRPETFQFEYDANGNPSRLSYTNNGTLSIIQTIQPTQININEAASNALDRGITYNVSYLDKRPSSYVVHSDVSAQLLAGVFTYDGKGRLATVTGGFADKNGVLETETATTVTINYDDNGNAIKLTYQNKDGITHTYTATGFDKNPTPYAGIKNSSFIQYDFYWIGTDLDYPRYVFDHLSAHNVLGYTATSLGTSFIYAENFKYKYNDKGQPTERNATGGEYGQTPTKGYLDSWTYNCQ